MGKSDFVIIGGVAAGTKTAAALARRLPSASITVFQKEEHISYGTCGLPYFASGDINSFKDLTITQYGVVRSPEFFKNSKGVDVFINYEVISIDKKAKTVAVNDLKTGETFEHGYGKLVLGTGANSAKSPFPVAESPRIKPFARPYDAINFRKMAQTGQIGTAVVVGGGFIGCEVAEAAGSLWGIEVTLVEKEKQLLPFVLDSEMAAIVSRELARQDVNVITGGMVEKIELNGESNPVVKIQGQDEIVVDYVFLCLGVKPEVSLAKACGLEIGETGGILVDKHLRTSDEHIYAGGDCVESYHQITGRKTYMPMGSLANRHGWIIAENLAGNDIEFPGVVGAFLVKVFDLNVGAVGLTETAAADAGIKAKSVWGSFPEKPDYYPEGKTITLKMVYGENDRKPLGLQAAGKGDICRRVDVMSSFLQRRATIEDLLKFEQGYAPPYSEALDPLHHLATMILAQGKGVSFISPGDDFENIDGDVIWLDVRETDEVKADSWPFANNCKLTNIPLNDLVNHLDELDRDKRIILICKRGPRSYQASIILKQAGFENVEIVGGGVTASLK
ncbi:MAG: FAD-dependent oxidoreductase [candidate division Zixibacteria bacterium]|nr:FAD-dependent oxidoreductase [candidate division Zixibacteria bacterium]